MTLAIPAGLTFACPVPTGLLPLRAGRTFPRRLRLLATPRLATSDLQSSRKPWWKSTKRMRNPWLGSRSPAGQSHPHEAFPWKSHGLPDSPGFL